MVTNLFSVSIDLCFSVVSCECNHTTCSPSFNWMFWTFIHVVSYTSALFLLFLISSFFIVWIKQTLYIHSPVNRYVDCLHFLVFMNYTFGLLGKHCYLTLYIKILMELFSSAGVWA